MTIGSVHLYRITVLAQKIRDRNKENKTTVQNSLARKRYFSFLMFRQYFRQTKRTTEAIIVSLMGEILHNFLPYCVYENAFLPRFPS